MRLLTGAALGALFASCLAHTAVSAATIIRPTSATVLNNATASGSIANAFNMSGLTMPYSAGITDFDQYFARTPAPAHNPNSGEWIGTVGLTTGQVTFDMGAAVGFDRLALWNEDRFGITQLALSTSLDGVVFTPLGSFAPGDNTYLASYRAEIFSFAPLEARFVRFAMSDCRQTAASLRACALGEVAFRSAVVPVVQPPVTPPVVGSAVPEPSTWAMMLMGFGAIGSIVRQAKRRRPLAST